MRSSSPSVSTRGPPGAGTALCTPPSGKRADDGVGELGLERRDLPAQLSARSALVGDDATRTSRTSSMGASLLGTAGVRKRLGAAEQRLLDVQRRHARATATAKSRRRALSRSGRRLGATSPKSTATGAQASATTTRPGARSGRVLALPQALARRRAAQPQRPVQARVVERPHRHAGLDHRDEQRVLQRPARDEAALHQAIERRRLDRRALRVGIEADVAEEGAVGAPGPARGAGSAPGRRGSGRPAAPGARAARSACAAPAPERPPRPAAARGTRARARGRPSPPRAPDPRRSRLAVIPRASRSSATKRRSSPASSSSPTLVACTTPPGSA